ncbi:MAG: hypothetical protein DRP74_00080 [Candidatus Omnitrophota bacterium]|nr:MAG: hypothetical protein DRP74_00080 [Candidatus Omnitrophota bacterium]
MKRLISTLSILILVFSVGMTYANPIPIPSDDPIPRERGLNDPIPRERVFKIPSSQVAKKVETVIGLIEKGKMKAAVKVITAMLSKLSLTEVGYLMKAVFESLEPGQTLGDNATFGWQISKLDNLNGKFIVSSSHDGLGDEIYGTCNNGKWMIVTTATATLAK